MARRQFNSIKGNRRILRKPAEKRLWDYLRAGWLKRYRIKRTSQKTMENAQ